MSARRIRNAWWADFRYAGARFRKRSPVNTKSGAVDYEVLLRLRLARGERLESIPDSLTETFASFADYWFSTYVTTNNKPSEQRMKRSTLDRHLLPAFGNQLLTNINLESIEMYKAAKQTEGLRPKTVNNHLTILAKCLRTAEEWQRLPRAPRIRLLKAPAPEVAFLDSEESKRLLADQAEPLWDGMAAVALRTGLRLGELLALEKRDADLRRRQLTVARSYVNGVLGTPKSNRTRRVPLTDDLCAFFAAAPSTGLIFARADGSAHGYGTAREGMIRLCRRTGLRRIGWHTLRHTFASDLVAAGVALPAVQQLLGHASITTTMRYAHLAPSALRGAIDALEKHLAHSPDSEVWAQVGNAVRKAVPCALDRQST